MADVRGAVAPEQSGFRHSRCTADCIAEISAYLEEAKYKKQAAYLVLLDIQSAFDSLAHASILDALINKGVAENLYRYVKSFLSGRTLRVKVGDSVSTPRHITKGVPQGSVLSPFLFNIVLANIPNLIPRSPLHQVRVSIYADDIALYCSGLTLSGRTKETAALLHEDCSGRVEINTDGSVLEGGASAAAACVVPSLGIARQSCLTCSASSTTAEVAALHLAADLILETPDLSPAVILSDSRAALTTLRRAHHTLPMYANLDSKLRQARELGRDVLLQWLPSHAGISGNEQADQLAKQAHVDGTPECTAMSPFDVARHNIKARIVAQHPDARVAAGKALKPISSRDFDLIDRTTLLRMRIGCASVDTTDEGAGTSFEGQEHINVPEIRLLYVVPKAHSEECR
ncbi:uncharacterized protein LOC144116007 [Amblyomma americanum]